MVERGFFPPTRKKRQSSLFLFFTNAVNKDWMSHVFKCWLIQVTIATLVLGDVLYVLVVKTAQTQHSVGCCPTALLVLSVERVMQTVQTVLWAMSVEQGQQFAQYALKEKTAPILLKMSQALPTALLELTVQRALPPARHVHQDITARRELPLA